MNPLNTKNMENKFKNNENLQSLIGALGLVEAGKNEEIDAYEFPFMNRNAESIQLSIPC
jgi:hypothetical protein